MNLQSTSRPDYLQRFASVHLDGPAVQDEVTVGEMVLERLCSERDIAKISYLRDEIDLPASALCDPGFRALEKKETRRASSAPCGGAAPSSAR